MRRDKKIREHATLEKHRREQRLEGLPEEGSPPMTASEEEDEDDDDDDAESWYDTMTALAHLPDVRSLQEPTGEGSIPLASRAGSTRAEEEGGALEGSHGKGLLSHCPRWGHR